MKSHKMSKHNLIKQGCGCNSKLRLRQLTRLGFLVLKDNPEQVDSMVLTLFDEEVGGSRRYRNTGYDQSQGRRPPSALK